MMKKILVIFLNVLIWTGCCTGMAIDQPISSHHHEVSGSSDCNAIDITCATIVNATLDKNDLLHLVWIANGHLLYGQSIDFGKSISHIHDLADHGKSLDSGTDARPQIVINEKQQILITYAFFKDNKWNAQINLIKSLDGGESFSTPKSFLPTRVSERFPSMMMDSSSRVHMVWIDKYLINEKRVAGKNALGGSIAYSYSDDYGNRFVEPKIINESSCECCHIAMARNGQDGLELAYRGILEGGVRDHVIQRISATQISEVNRVADDQWKTDVCPHQGPTIAVDGLGRTHVVWYTMGDNRHGVYRAHTVGQGNQFTMPIKVGSEHVQVSRPNLVSVGDQLWLVSEQFDGQNTNIVLQTSNDNGDHWEKEKIIAATQGYADHPLLIVRNKVVYLSWFSTEFGYQFIKLN